MIRPFIAIIVGWLLIIPLLWISLMLAYKTNSFLTTYHELSKNDLTNKFLQNPGEAYYFLLSFFVALLIATFFSSLVAGLIARKKGLLVGGSVPLILLIIGIIGSINRGSYHFALSVNFIFVLLVGAIAGYLGVKISKKNLRT